MEDFENTYIGKLWNILLSDDKRSFNEYFSEEFGITLDDCITDKQICFLCKSMMRLNDEQLREVDSIREYQWEDGSWIEEEKETEYVCDIELLISGNSMLAKSKEEYIDKIKYEFGADHNLAIDTKEIKNIKEII
tara:strand:- start:17 stop:421 length:405 start_codon:yes stop_codon:yes gene_type:complete